MHDHSNGKPDIVGSYLSPSLKANDIAETIAFYRDTLGFSWIGRWPEEDPPEWVAFERGHIVLQFHNFKRGRLVGVPANLTGTLYFRGTDVDALAAEYRGKVPFEWGPEQMFYGWYEFGIRDCNGYYLAFAEDRET